MKISMNWISEYVSLDGIDVYDLINKITLSTAEVEGIEEKGKDVSGVITAKIISVNPHPNSKKLRLVEADAGGTILSCVCGAPNAREGMIVPFAGLGAQVGELTIAKVSIAGVESCGMCCSAKELGISDDHSGLFEFPQDTELGVDIKEIIPIEDIVFEIDNKSLTNRPDLWCHYGFAREISAITGRKLRPLSLFELDSYNDLPKVNIQIDDPERCYRYTGLIIKNVKAKVSALQMQIRLYYCGMRALNLLADLTNYVMLDVGQPMHAFDYKKVSEIHVKRYDNEFNFTTLDGNDRKISPETLMICNQEEPIAIAGIMGGLESEICDDTDSLLLESANFNGVTTRKSSAELGLRTESSIRYEKILDPNLTDIAIKRFVYLLNESDSGIEIASSLTDEYARVPENVNLKIDHSFITKIIGKDLGEEKVISILESLDFKVEALNGTYSVDVPSYRSTKDITIPADLVEEITRIYGYNNLTPVSAESYLTPVRHSEERELEYNSKRLLAERFDLNEVHTYIWNNLSRDKDLGIKSNSDIKIVNSISPETTSVRKELAPSLIGAINENRFYSDDFGIFEVGRTADSFDKNDNVIEKKKLCIILASRNLDDKNMYLKIKDIVVSLFTDLKNNKPDFMSEDLSSEYNWCHPVNTATILIDGIGEIGYISLLTPLIKEKIDKKLNVSIAELDFNRFASCPKIEKRYTEVSKYPEVELDLNFIVDSNMNYEVLDRQISVFKSDILRSYYLYDIYEDEATLKNKKSMTIKFILGSYESTLKSEQVSGFSNEMVEHCAEIGAELRSL